MRNLHHIGIRYNTPSFLSVLAELNIIVSPEQDKQAIRRFLMGHNMTPVAHPVRSSVKRTLSIPAEFNDTGGLNSFFDSGKEQLLSALSEHGICENDVQGVDVYHDDGQNFFEVTYMGPENDQELAKRQRYADIFNSMLSNQEAIDAKCYHIHSLKN